MFSLCHFFLQFGWVLAIMAKILVLFLRVSRLSITFSILIILMPAWFSFFLFKIIFIFTIALIYWLWNIKLFRLIADKNTLTRCNSIWIFMFLVRTCWRKYGKLVVIHEIFVSWKCIFFVWSWRNSLNRYLLIIGTRCFS